MSNGNNNARIQAAIASLLEKKRIVFWYDEGGEMEESVRSLDIPGAEVLKLDGNPFTIKYRILKEPMPEKGYIVYRKERRPEDEDNWLLDLEMDGIVFAADQTSLYASECGIAMELRHKTVAPHLEFFKNAKNREKLARLLKPGMGEESIITNMIFVAVNGEPSYDRVLLRLAEEAIEGRKEISESLAKSGLDKYVWDEIEYRFGYKGKREVKELMITLFKDDMNRHHSGATLSNEAQIFMRDWRDSLKYAEAYKKWAALLETYLGIVKQIRNWPIEDLLDIETFPSIDKIIAVQLQKDVINETIGSGEVEAIVRKRQHKLFKDVAPNSLTALLEACKLTESIKTMIPGLLINTPEEGFNLYVSELHKIDLHYRRFIRAAKESEGKKMIVPLLEKVQRLYSITYLDELARQWQPVVDGMEKWAFNTITSQREFYQTYVAPYVEKNRKIFVIISDALRYETMTELQERIGGIDRAVATMQPAMYSTQPSYTQLGMAALLPHRQLSYEKQQDEVFADGISTKGTPQREKVLKQKGLRSRAMTDEEFLEITDPKSAFKEFDLIYIYSNKIDFTGDKRETEGEVFKATEDEFENILNIIRQIKNGNGSNILITSDHGYLYQNEPLDESEFSDYKAAGNIIADTRRYVIGENLSPSTSMKTWKSEDVGLKPGKEIQTAKGMNRMRKQGAGSRFVHGGAMLQEIVVPVLHVNIKKSLDISQVDVDVLNIGSRLTTNRQTIKFYQMEPVNEKSIPSVIKAGFYDEDGTLLSDMKTLTFDCRNTDSQQREQKHTFIFKSELSSLNGKEVTLRLERKVRDSEQYVVYNEIGYKVSVMFANEF